ncbi:MAG: hypothetical protein J7M34_08455 [Anaerolineae bacterium]|nr:hypothetical protein [Anaerolineae bacterium]
MRVGHSRTHPNATSDMQHLPPPILVQTATEMRAMMDHLLAQPRVAVDTEADSLFSYYHKVCLIQFSTPDTDYLVDPLASAVTPLACWRNCLPPQRWRRYSTRLRTIS